MCVGLRVGSLLGLSGCGTRLGELSPHLQHQMYLRLPSPLTCYTKPSGLLHMPQGLECNRCVRGVFIWLYVKHLELTFTDGKV